MNAPVEPLTEKFAIGQPVSRKEDPTLLRGLGRYSDDLSLPGQLYAVLVRSPYPHGVLRGIDAEAARAMPGVAAVITQSDLDAAGIGQMPFGLTAAKHSDGSDAPRPRQTPLASGRVRYVGDPVALVVAETIAAARDAAEAVMLDVDALPAVTRASEAAAPGATAIHDAAPDNVALRFHHGDSQAVAAAFRDAAHVTRLDIINSRVVVSPMEPRSATGEWDGSRWTLRVGSQGVFGLRANVAGVLGIKPEALRVLTGNVGGSFGMKATCYPEYVAVLHAARALGRPVKWTDTRSESFLSDSHGRDHEQTVELALDAGGKFLALRVTGVGNVGAYLSNATTMPPTGNTTKNIIGVYATPLLEVNVRCLFTNTTPVGAYRGAGRPEGNYYMERLVETAAREMGIDPIELRRRNHIRPEQIPYETPAGTIYDSGDFPAVMDDALARADWDGYAARRAESRRRGKVRGRGVGHYLEVTAPPTREMGGIRFEPDGTVTIITGTLDYGQGHASPFAQVLHDRLGVPFDAIRLLQGDSDQLIAGGGTGGSKSIMASGAAIVEASAKVVEAGRRIAAQALEVGEADVEFEARAAGGGRFAVAGTDRGIGIMELAAQLRDGTLALPAGLPRTLDVQHIHESAPSAYPNGCHVAEVELDPETGVIEVSRYVMVNDFGTVINPMLVAGQAHGGVVQGIGQALMERTAYDADGQFVTGSYMDYQLPRAYEIPQFDWGSHPVPARTNILGAKGCGEAGCAGSLPAVMNAVVDALSEFGIRHIDMPATFEKVWQMIQQARRSQAA